jgi:AAA+ ATPase superfamily predicted ATPase
MLLKYPLIDRKETIALFKDFLQKEQLRVLLVKGEAMMGKSRVLQEYARISEAQKIRSVFIDLKSTSEEFLVLYEIAQQIDINLFPKFSEAYAKFINQSTNVNQVNQFFSKMTIRDDSAEKLNCEPTEHP